MIHSRVKPFAMMYCVSSNQVCSALTIYGRCVNIQYEYYSVNYLAHDDLNCSIILSVVMGYR